MTHAPASSGEAPDPRQLAELVLTRLDRPVPDDTDTCRLLHGRGGTLPGFEELVVDRFGGTLRIGVHGERSAGWRQALADALAAAPARPDGVWLQWRGRPDAPVERLCGTPSASLEVRESGLRFLVHPGEHRNAGLFLDAAPARARVRALAAGGARVLNLFAYTCAFSVAALAGGAAEVVNLDMAKGALAAGRENHRRNGLRGAVFLPHELFRSWGALRRRGPFDLVILDPPSFQRGSFEADRDWPKLLGRLDALTAPDGQVLVCLNSPFHDLSALDAWRAERAPGFRVAETLAPSPDFPERDPARGLKVQRWMRAPIGAAGRD